ADIRSHSGSLCGDPQLACAGAEHGPAIIVTKEPVGCALHMRDVFGMRADAAEKPKDGLDEERRLDEFAVGEMRQIVKVCDIVALEFETGAVVVAGRKNEFDVLEAVAEDQVTRGLEMRFLPIELELLVFGQEMIQAKINRAHVQRSDFGLEG